MNLLCPNCQKPLTVPEQYAGQPMRCPLCSGTFTVPALPTQAASSVSAPLPPPSATPAAPADTYGLKDPVAPPAPPPSVSNLVLEEAPLTSRAPSTRTGGAPHHTFTEAEPSYPSTPTPEGYQRKYTIWFSPKYLQYVAPVALFLVFLLTFFPWVGVYPGGVADAWQNAWQAAIGWTSNDPDVINETPPFPTYTEKTGDKVTERTTTPGFNVLLFFYLPLLLVTLLIALGCLALVFAPQLKLPPAAHPALPWRWGIVAGLDLILLFFLVLQLIFGFSLVDNVLAATDSNIAAHAEARKGGNSTTPQLRQDAIERGLARQALRRTIWLDLVVFLHLVALAGAGLMFCVNRRGARPAPRIDTLW